MEAELGICVSVGGGVVGRKVVVLEIEEEVGVDGGEGVKHVEGQGMIGLVVGNDRY